MLIISIAPGVAGRSTLTDKDLIALVPQPLVIEKEIPTIIYAENKEKISKKKKKTTLYVETDGENIEFKSCV